MENNLKLWNSVCETDPDYTKHVTQRGGYTSVSPQYQIREATEQFGPYGSGWGFESISFDYRFVSDSGLVIINAVFFYILNEKRATFPITNAWPMKSGAGDKARFDPDFAKKAETNTMSKALSKLGFSADVFLGHFDDAEYVNMMDAKARIESDDDDKVRQVNDEFKAWFTKECDAMHLLQNDRAVNLVYNKIYSRMQDKLTIIKASPEKREAFNNKIFKECEIALTKLGEKKNG
jgi:hypothetical protein